MCAGPVAIEKQLSLQETLDISVKNPQDRNNIGEEYTECSLFPTRFCFNWENCNYYFY